MEAIFIYDESLAGLRTRLEGWKRRMLGAAGCVRPGDEALDMDELRDEVDAAAMEHSRSLVFRLREREGSMLRRIEAALERIGRGRFHTCDRCGQEIPRERLEAQPLATVCVECKEEEELELRRSFGRSSMTS